MIRNFILLFFVSVGSLSLAYGEMKVDKNLPAYKKVRNVSGNLNSVGSDTLNNLMTLWAEEFKKTYYGVKISIEGKGSSTAPPALIEGVSQLGPMSRKMKASELDKFEKQFGYKPVEIPVAIDAVAVYVHRDNPVKGISMGQLDSIFSSTYKRGGEAITMWKEMGLKGDLGRQKISLYGRNSASGTYAYFKKFVLKKGDYSKNVKEQPGSSAVVQSVGKELSGMGYSGIGYRTSDVRAVKLSDDGKVFYAPSYENCLKNKYPLARFLYVYVNKNPKKKMDKLTAEFLKLVLSKSGQKVVVKDGYYPLNTKMVKKIRKQLKI